MQQKYTLLILLLFAGIWITELKAQSLVVKAKDGTENLKQLNTLKKITFSNDNLLINYLSGPTDLYRASNIRKIYFKSGTTGTNNIALNDGTGDISIYPNPVNNIVYIQNSSKNTSNVAIFRMDGIMVLRTQATPGIITFNVSNLPTGPYLIRVNNQVFKFIKL